MVVLRSNTWVFRSNEEVLREHTVYNVSFLEQLLGFRVHGGPPEDPQGTTNHSSKSIPFNFV